MTPRYLVADVFDGLATLEDNSVDLIVTSPPFLALRSYLPADHPDKSKEIGSEATPAEFLDVLLRVTAEWRRVLAPHGSIAVELGDTYAPSGPNSGNTTSPYRGEGADGITRLEPEDHRTLRQLDMAGWPLAKSKTLIPELYRLALAYGFNPLTGEESPAGRWLVRNVVTWCRPNPPVGALGDKWRPATSDVVVACTSPKRFWDDLATRRPVAKPDAYYVRRDEHYASTSNKHTMKPYDAHQSSGAPLLDYWEIPPGGYKGSHYAVFPPELAVPLVKAMCPQKVCRVCGEPSRRIVEPSAEYAEQMGQWTEWGGDRFGKAKPAGIPRLSANHETTGWTSCGHDDYRPGLVLDPFAGSGTTLMVAHGHGFDTIGIDLDERNAELALERVGPMFLEVEVPR